MDRRTVRYTRWYVLMSVVQDMIILYKSSQLIQYTHLVYIIVSCTTSKAGEAQIGRPGLRATIAIANSTIG